ncbi:MAG: UDP-N-acetylmuramoyl-L-alanyl-D-glutamate--2,6-diaminopimelate ligase [Candidatus Kaelpia aquatica]|nr:UDP-N-acetylmuramoyl-L-alanyl-D-glutamate--2,6-diaminopimelate ligase [Candidatus Kaelpia aquatica]
MQLSRVLSGIDFQSRNFQNLNLKGISIDSNKIQRDFMFLAIKGENRDGHDFIYHAIERGASVILVEEGRFSEVVFSGRVVLIEVKDPKAVLAKVSSNFYQTPENLLYMVGITGTNGKTTISFILEHIFKKAGLTTGLIGTICYRIGNREIPAFNTTPDAITIRRYIREVADLSGDAVFMETSSHGLIQGRLKGIGFDSAVFTNLDKDHLDYHKDMDGYYQAKKILFTELLKKDGFGVMNLDDPYGRRLYEDISQEKVSYGFSKDADIAVLDHKLDIKGTSLRVKIFGEVFSFNTPMIGIHNIYNILAAIGVAIRYGLDKELVVNAIESFKGVRGRLERVFGSSEVKVFIDYAHTPKALEEMLKLFKSLKKNNLWVVFGCGGDRYKDKRSQMGRIASSLADKIIVTTDNPRSENPLNIIEDIKKGLGQLGSDCCIVPDRKEAIEKAVYESQKNDIVLIAGKGHEKYQLVDNLVIPFDDKEVAKKALAMRIMERMANV